MAVDWRKDAARAILHEGNTRARSRTNTRRGKVDWEREANGITADIPERAILLDISTVLV